MTGNTVPPAQTGASRRSMLRGAAWSVPVNSLTAASPTFADSTNPNAGLLRVDVLEGAWRAQGTLSQEYMALRLEVENLDLKNTANGISFFVQFPSAWLTNGAAIPSTYVLDFDTYAETGLQNFGTNWSKSANTYSGIERERTGGAPFTYVGAIPPGGTSSQLSFVVHSGRMEVLGINLAGDRSPILVANQAPAPPTTGNPTTFSMSPDTAVQVIPTGL